MSEKDSRPAEPRTYKPNSALKKLYEFVRI